MAKYRTIFIVVVAGIIISSCSKEEPRSLSEVISYSLEECRQLVDADNYWKFGFKSHDEVAQMTPGDSIPVYFVGLEKLRALQAGEAPDKLLDDVNEVIYPILVNGEQRSSISLKKQPDGGWKVWNFGRPKMSTAIASVRDENAAASGREVKHYFAVEIPAMYLVFVGHFDGDVLMLTHVHPDDAFQLQPGKTEPGADVIARLVAGAKNFESPLSAL